MLIKLPTPYGWLTSYLYTGGLSYAFGRPSESNILRYFNPKDGWIVVDVGAHVGWYTLIASKKVGPKGKVIAIEPEPRNFTILCKNIKDNRLNNVIPLRIALSDRDCCVALKISSSPAQHSIISRYEKGALMVEGKRLDTLMKELMIGKVDLLKIDVEGHEVEVLKGGEKSLREGRISELIVESFRPSAVKCYLESFGYEVKVIDNFNLWAYKRKPASVVGLDYGACNFVRVKGSDPRER